MRGTGKLPEEQRREIAGILLLAFTVLLFLALVTDQYQGNVHRPIDDISSVRNALGRPGALASSFLCLLFGHGAHALYCITGIWGGMLLSHRKLDRIFSRLIGLFLVCCATATLFHVTVMPSGEGPHAGGAVGWFFGSPLVRWFGIIGSTVLAVTCILVGVLLSTDFLFVRMLDWLRRLAQLLIGLTGLLAGYLTAQWEARRNRRGVAAAGSEPQRVRRSRVSSPGEETGGAAAYPAPVVTAPDAASGVSDEELPRSLPNIRLPRPTAEEVSEDGVAEPLSVVEALAEAEPAAGAGGGASSPELPLQEGGGAEKRTGPARVSVVSKKQGAPSLRRKGAIDEELPADYVYPKQYVRPPLDLFDLPPVMETKDLSEQLHKTSELLEETLRTFAIEARVTDITRGPTITRYEIEPAPGVKVNRFLALADDLALALKAHRVRVEAPIPGKGRVGVEVPNTDREPVVMREILESRAFQRTKAKLPLAFGKDIAGEVMVTDLASMPHLLVAGATGAGKTVCVKTLLASLLCTKTPEELQVMLIDPKMVELSIFNDIPHLITPVVTDPKKAASALNWLIIEMEERYRLFAHLRVRNVEVYNKSVENGEIEVTEAEGTGGDSINAIRKLPYIVCVIDELADLMMLARAEVEDAIARLAQLARAVGIHLVIATQRPSVDVLTGVIKANFPSRVSFQVSSRVDSRCILDEIGAERLIGKGDMLYLPAGQSKPTRIQGVFVSDDEMNGLIAYLKTQAPPQYRDEIAKFGKSKDALDEAVDEDDELLDEAVRVVLETGQASISMVQRRLRVGYTRAARLIDMMELRGIVGPHSGSKAREILVDLPRTDEVA